MQGEVLERVKSENLAVFVVWEQILRTDGKVPARRATSLVPDPRAVHYWTDDSDVGRAFQRALNLDEAAWDVYLLYPPGVEWKGPAAPAPLFFMHQLTGRLPDELLLDGDVLAEKTEAVIRRRGSARAR